MSKRSVIASSLAAATVLGEFLSFRLGAMNIDILRVQRIQSDEAPT